eukprot:TRINITY_DN10827_c0_g1_i1.p1 TRINITY_DN10827_c0_g1~~TRINITY_DN10827_c0_g1_i1.p1  ORF type:complete len:910 (-),score=260.82 TRINITY_DN10827_c0_g1_i1:58-2787(-)
MEEDLISYSSFSDLRSESSTDSFDAPQQTELRELKRTLSGIDSHEQQHQEELRNFEKAEASIGEVIQSLDVFVKNLKNLCGSSRKLDNDLKEFYGKQSRLGLLVSTFAKSMNVFSRMEDGVNALEKSLEASKQDYGNITASFKERFSLRKVIEQNYRSVKRSYKKIIKKGNDSPLPTPDNQKKTEEYDRQKKTHDSFNRELNGDLKVFYCQKQDPLDPVFVQIVTLQHILQKDLDLYDPQMNELNNRISTRIEDSKFAAIDEFNSFRTFLNNSVCLDLFKVFLIGEHSEENLVFWNEAEKFKLMKDKNLMRMKAKYLYQMFLKAGANLELNLPHNTFTIIRNRFEKPNYVPDSSAFDEAAKEIFNLMQTDSFERFKKSDFQKILKLRFTQRDFTKYNVPQGYEDLESKHKKTLANAKLFSTSLELLDNSSRKSQFASRSKSFAAKRSGVSDTDNLHGSRIGLAEVMKRFNPPKDSDGQVDAISAAKIEEADRLRPSSTPPVNLPEKLDKERSLKGSLRKKLGMKIPKEKEDRDKAASDTESTPVKEPPTERPRSHSSVSSKLKKFFSPSSSKLQKSSSEDLAKNLDLQIQRRDSEPGQIQTGLRPTASTSSTGSVESTGNAEPPKENKKPKKSASSSSSEKPKTPKSSSQENIIVNKPAAEPPKQLPRTVSVIGMAPNRTENSGQRGIGFGFSSRGISPRGSPSVNNAAPQQKTPPSRADSVRYINGVTPPKPTEGTSRGMPIGVDAPLVVKVERELERSTEDLHKQSNAQQVSDEVTAPTDDVKETEDKKDTKNDVKTGQTPPNIVLQAPKRSSSGRSSANLDLEWEKLTRLEEELKMQEEEQLRAIIRAERRQQRESELKAEVERIMEQQREWNEKRKQRQQENAKELAQAEQLAADANQRVKNMLK